MAMADYFQKKPKFKKISWKKLRNITKETSEWKKFSNLICRQAEEENYWEEEKKKKKKWIRDNMNMCQCTGPASQITILEKKKKLTWAISYGDKTFMTFHHDAPNSHVNFQTLISLSSWYMLS